MTDIADFRFADIPLLALRSTLSAIEQPEVGNDYDSGDDFVDRPLPRGSSEPITHHSPNASTTPLGTRPDATQPLTQRATHDSDGKLPARRTPLQCLTFFTPYSLPPQQTTYHPYGNA